MDMVADEDQTALNQGSRIEFWVTQVGANVITKQFTIGSNGIVSNTNIYGTQMFANNFIGNITATVSSASNVILTTQSTTNQNVTAGTGNQGFILPNATTLVPGLQYIFNNNSSGTISVYYNGGTLLGQVPPGAITVFQLLTNLTANGSWDRHSFIPSYAQWGSTGISMGGGSISSMLNITGSGYANIAGVVVAGNVSTAGTVTTGNLITTNGVYWSNGAAYSTGSGSSFTGNLAGQTLYDGVNNYITANAYPFNPISTSVGSSYQQLYFRNPKPVYVNNILQNNSITNGYIINSSQNANITLRTGSGTQQTVYGTSAYMQVWPANVTMSNGDRYRSALFVSEVNLNGATWGTMSSAAVGTPTLVGFNSIASVLGYGNAAHVIANYSSPYIVPANGSANVQYADAVFGDIRFVANVSNNYTASNVAYARLVAGTITTAGNLTAQYAIGLHTISGWAGTGSVITNQRYAVLNEDAATIIQTNGNIVTSATATTGFNSAGVFTVTQLNAVTGVVGQMAAVSNGTAKNGGQFAYWDTTNARWSWFDTNLAVS
jgi:hypothetical protein